MSSHLHGPTPLNFFRNFSLLRVSLTPFCVVITDMHHKIIDTSRSHFAYLEDGPQDGELVICLHGFPDHAPSWHALMPHLANEGYRVIAPWLRGYAPSVTEGAFDIDSLTADTVELARSFSKDNLPINLVGHDWGAVLTWLAVAHHPELFKSAVTLAVPHPLQFFELLLKSPSQLGRSGYMGLSNCVRSDWVVARDNFSFIDLCGKMVAQLRTLRKLHARAERLSEAVHPRATQLLPAHVATTHPVYPALGEPQSARA